MTRRTAPLQERRTTKTKRNAYGRFSIGERSDAATLLTRARADLWAAAANGTAMSKVDGARFTPGDTVALFIPCFVDALYPAVGMAAVTIFERLGVRVAYPAEQTCCGQPAFNAGHWHEARSLAARFAQVFADQRWIVVPSGSCGAMARRFYAQMEPDGAAAAVGARVYDLATFLVEILGIVDVGARFPHSVAYLDGCHGRRELRCTDAAERLLHAVGDIEMRPLSGADECCGFGGLFSVKYDGLSTSMGDAKTRNALATGAEYLVSGDASCLMHVGGMLAHRGAAMRPMHIAEVLASR